MLSNAKCFQTVQSKKQVDETLLLVPLLEAMYKKEIINTSTYVNAKKGAEKYVTTTILK